MSKLKIVKDQDQGPGEYVRVIPQEGVKFDADEVLVSIKNQFNEKYLATDGTWHAEESEFGPYEVDPDGYIIIGPEICQHIDSFTPIVFSAGNLSQILSWSPQGEKSPPVDPPVDESENDGKVEKEDNNQEALVGQRDEEIETLNKEIERLKDENKQLAEAGAGNGDEKLNEEIKQYKTEISQLKEDKEKLENKVKLLMEAKARKSSKLSTVVIILFFLIQIVVVVSYCSPEVLDLL